MILKRIVIPDAIWDQLAARHKTDDQTIEDIIKRLRQTAHTSVSEKTLVLSSYDRGKLEFLLNITINSPEDLLKEIARLLAVKIDGVEVTLDTELCEALRNQSEFYGQEPKDYLSELVKEKMVYLLQGN